MKKNYLEPETKTVKNVSFSRDLLLEASNEGIGDGGEGNADDDPTAKRRDQESEDFQGNDKGWGDLW